MGNTFPTNVSHSPDPDPVSARYLERAKGLEPSTLSLGSHIGPSNPLKLHATGFYPLHGNSTVCSALPSQLPPQVKAAIVARERFVFPTAESINETVARARFSFASN